MNFIINPGTEPIANSKLANAQKAAELFLKDINVKDMSFELESNENHNGYFDFIFKRDKFKIQVSFPGSDPLITRKSEPWVSPRIYVDGSSWLWGYGLGIFEDKLKDYFLLEATAIPK